MREGARGRRRVCAVRGAREDELDPVAVLKFVLVITPNELVVDVSAILREVLEPRLWPMRRALASVV